MSVAYTRATAIPLLVTVMVSPRSTAARTSAGGGMAGLSVVPGTVAERGSLAPCSRHRSCGTLVPVQLA
ncbi:hypothetical protein TK78_19960 [Streptomyces sp. Tue 6075]|nr:hypothetical protein TK78_19960 [Streptomyces sp. Tue 6075]